MCSIPFFDASNCGVLEVLQVTGTAHGPFFFFFFYCQIIGCLFDYHFFYTMQLSSVGYVATFSTFDSTIFRTRDREVDRRNVLRELFYIVIKGDIF